MRARNERRQKTISGPDIYVYIIKTFFALASVIQSFRAAQASFY